MSYAVKKNVLVEDSVILSPTGLWTRVNPFHNRWAQTAMMELLKGRFMVWYVPEPIPRWPTFELHSNEGVAARARTSLQLASGREGKTTIYFLQFVDELSQERWEAWFPQDCR